MRMTKRIATLTLALALAAFTGSAFAQALVGSVQGRVIDEQGAVLPGVTVTLTGKTGSQTQQTDAQGDYRFIGLNPDTYKVKADLQGFVGKEQTATVGIGQTVEVK